MRNFTLILTIVIFLLNTFAASAADPYAEMERQHRAANYYALRAKAAEYTKLAFFAQGCGVLSSNGAMGIRNWYWTPLYGPSTGLDATSNPITETRTMEAMIHAAEREGLEKAKQPGACNWFLDNPDVTMALRDAQRAGVH